MKKLLLLAAFAATPMLADAQSTYYVSPYVKSDGTLVQGHMKTAPNATPTTISMPWGLRIRTPGRTKKNELSSPPAYNKGYANGYQG